MEYKTLVSIAVLAVSTLLIAGCASNHEKKECLSADWYAIGVEDGKRGYSLKKVEGQREICAKFNLPQDLTRYEEGLKTGYEAYCTRENGYKTGRQGLRDHYVCVGETRVAFSNAYSDGKEIYDILWIQTYIEKEIQKYRTEIATVLSTIAHTENKLSSTTTPEELDKLEAELAERKRNVHVNTRIIEDLIHRLNETQPYLEKLQKDHRALGYD